MKWTKKYPQKTGFYWWRNKDFFDIHTVVFYDAETNLATVVGGDVSRRPEEIEGEWIGPIPEPEKE